MPTHAPRASWPLVLAVALLSGCATVDESAYPSLDRRAVEARIMVAPASPETTQVPALTSATLAEALERLGADADRGEAAFRAALAESRAAIDGGRNTTIGSEDWALAQRALSRVDVARGPTSLALAELDRLAIDADNRDDLAALEAISAVQGRVLALSEAQRAELAGLAAVLAGE